MNPRISKLAPILSAGLLLSFGFILKGPPRDPDVMMGLEQVAGSFLVFLAWAVCALSWGRWIARRLGFDGLELGRLAPAAVFGPVFLSLLAYFLGVLGLIGYELAPLHAVLLLLGPVLLARAAADGTKPPARFGRPHWSEVVLSAGLAYSFLSQVLRASLANGTTDPPMYHLLGPRLWSETGAIRLWPQWPALAHATYWEHLFIWGNSLVGGREGQGLIEGQFFGQWTQVFFGLGATLAVLFVLQRLLGVSRSWAWAGCLAASISRAQIHYAPLAKNDYGIEAWVLLALALLLSRQGSRPRWVLLSGILIGMGIMGKMVVLLSIAPLAVIWAAALLKKTPPRDAARTLLVFGAGAFAGMLPILARNFWFTSNPLFPVLHSWFPDQGWLASYSQHAVNEVQALPLRDWRGFLAQLRPALFDSPLTPAALLLVPLAIAGWVSPSQGWLAIGAMTGAAGYCALALPNSFLRWVAPSLGLLQIGGAAALESLCSRALKSPGVRSAIAIVPACWIVLHAEYPGRPWRTLVHGPSPTMAWRTPSIANGGDSKAWLRMNAKAGEVIASTGDTGFYYLYYLRPFAVFQQPVLDSSAGRCGSVDCYVRALRSYHVKYLYDVAHWSQRYYSRAAAELDRALDAEPRALVYEGSDSFVVDLPALEEDLMSACVPEHPARDDFLIP